MAKLVIAFPQAGYNDIELDVLADMWAEDLEDMSDQEFLARVKEYRKSSRWFPTSSELLAINLAEAHPPEHKELPEKPQNFTDEDIEKNKARVGKILDMLKHKQAM